MTKQTTLIFVALCWTLVMVNAVHLNAQKKLFVVSSASIFDDMVKEIGGERVTSRSIVPIGSDPHKYEATPSDVTLLTRADLIMINGLTFEGWIQKVIDNSGTKAKTILLTKGIVPISSQDHKGATDPHAWMDASNGTIYAENIYNALAEADPAGKDYYREQYNKYRVALLELDVYITRSMQKVPASQRILVTSHDAFSYFGRRYGLAINAVMGVSTEADAQTSDMMRIVSAIKKHGVPAIFVESTINPKMLQQIARDNGVKIGGELYADSLGEVGSSGETYIGMLTHNAEIIVSALAGISSSTSDVTSESANSSSTPMWAYGVIGAIMALLFVVMYRKMSIA